MLPTYHPSMPHLTTFSTFRYTRFFTCLSLTTLTAPPSWRACWFYEVLISVSLSSTFGMVYQYSRGRVVARSELNMLGSTRYKWYRSKEKTHSYFVFLLTKLSNYFWWGMGNCIILLIICSQEKFCFPSHNNTVKLWLQFIVLAFTFFLSQV